jgi:hypothetical protein
MNCDTQSIKSVIVIATSTGRRFITAVASSIAIIAALGAPISRAQEAKSPAPPQTRPSGQLSTSESQAAKLPDNWEQLPLKELSRAATKFYRVHGHCTECAKTRAQFAAFVWDRYLASDDKVRAAAGIDKESTFILARSVAQGLTPQHRAALLQSIRGLVASASATKTFSASEILSCQGALLALGDDPTSSVAFTESWLNSGDRIKQLSMWERIQFEALIDRIPGQNAQQIRRELASQAWQDGLAPTTRPQPLNLPSDLAPVYAFASHLDAAKEASLLTELVGRLEDSNTNIASLSLPQLPVLTGSLRRLHANDEQIAAVLAAWAAARDGQPASILDSASPPVDLIACESIFSSKKTMGLYTKLHSQLDDGNRVWGEASIQLLTASAVAIGGIGTWKSSLAEKVNNTPQVSDRRAALLLAQAEAASWGSLPTAQGTSLATQALSAASSEWMRLTCGFWLARYEILDSNFDAAKATLAKLRSNAPDAQTKSTLEIGEKKLYERIAEIAEMQQQLTTVQDIGRLTGRLKVLREQMSKLVSGSEPQAEIQRLQQLIEGTNQELVKQQSKLDVQ